MPFLFLLAVAATAVIVLVRWWRDPERRTRSAIRQARRTLIAEVPADLPVKIVGAVRTPKSPLRAPLTGRVCVAYDVHVQMVGNNRRDTLIRARDFCEFVLEDASGRALVVPFTSAIAIVKDRHSSSGLLADATPEQQAFLAAHGEKSVGPLGLNRPLVFQEGILEEGEQVAVVGMGRWEADPEPDAEHTGGYRNSARRLRMQDAAWLPLQISDDHRTFG